MMDGHGKSDSPEVPAKPPNKDGRRRRRNYGAPYTGTKAETPDTAKGAPTVTQSDAGPTAEGVISNGHSYSDPELIARGGKPPRASVSFRRSSAAPFSAP